MDKLTSKQLKVLELLAEGYSNQEIADELKIPYQTVKNRISAMLKKFNIYDRTQLVVIYYKDIIKKIEGE